MDLVGEAVRAIALACNLTLIVPGIVLVFVAGRRAPFAGLGYLMAAVLTRWAQTAGWITAPDDQLAAVPVAVGTALVVTGSSLLATADGGRMPRISAGAPALGGGIAGAVMSLLWRPCTGEALGDAITATIESPVRGLLPLGAYLLIVTLPIALASALPAAVPVVGRVIGHRSTGTIATALAVGIIVLMALGSWHDLVGELYRRSGGA